ncbi:uncharacterized protein CLUP02_16533 [Colletotrichum lupini]|uniref:Uncharacterized protein n=1 Tax=Colletotrichum lupini TaxID=145971 RepID=A0A9Q8T8Y9_9PEZI|nr:uncharacterized protein CLUP02_16533 [Colletotrichum lupini]UQC91000.1 hypothetical protein CLUP02_16533 [Colletotrichum lupini]
MRATPHCIAREFLTLIRIPQEAGCRPQLKTGMWQALLCPSRLVFASTVATSISHLALAAQPIHQLPCILSPQNMYWVKQARQSPVPIPSDYPVRCKDAKYVIRKFFAEQDEDEDANAPNHADEYNAPQGSDGASFRIAYTVVYPYLPSRVFPTWRPAGAPSVDWHSGVWGSDSGTPVSDGQDGGTKHTLVNTWHAVSYEHTAIGTDNTCAVFELKLMQGIYARAQQLVGLFYQLSGRSCIYLTYADLNVCAQTATGVAKNKLQLHSLDTNALRVPVMTVTWNRVKKSTIPDTCLIACKLGERYWGILIPLTGA